MLSAILLMLASEAMGDSTRVYLIEGMTCGGCAFAVEKAIQRAGFQKSQIVEIDYGKAEFGSVGHIKLRLNQDSGQDPGMEMDCRVIQAIQKYSGYLAYLDAANKHPCDKK